MTVYLTIRYEIQRRIIDKWDDRWEPEEMHYEISEAKRHLLRLRKSDPTGRFQLVKLKNSREVIG